MKKLIILFSAAAFLLSGCFKTEDPISPNPVGPIEEKVIPMTEYYENQVYFNLETGEQVSLNNKNDFDLSFACHDTSFLIRLNTAVFMTAAETGITDITKEIDTAGLVWAFDKSDGNPDSTALINWLKINGNDTSYSENVWVINRGINNQGFPLGLMKIKFHGLTNDTYTFSYSEMDNSISRTVKIEKNPGYNYIQYIFESEGDPQQIEPKTNNWDLLFTQYTTLLYTDAGEAYPYLVTGTLINETGTRVAFDSTLVFEDIVIDDVIDMEFSKELDYIGYEWKELVGDPSGGDFYYKAHSDWNYIILAKGMFYKLRFTGFYDEETGEKGYPTFEFQRL